MRIVNTLYQSIDSHRWIWNTSLVGLCVAYAVYCITVGGLDLATNVFLPLATILGGYVLGFILRAIVRATVESDRSAEFKTVVVLIPMLFLIQFVVTIGISIVVLRSTPSEDIRSHVMSYGSQIFSRPGLVIVPIRVALSFFSADS